MTAFVLLPNTIPAAICSLPSGIECHDYSTSTKLDWSDDLARDRRCSAELKASGVNYSKSTSLLSNRSVAVVPFEVRSSINLFAYTYATLLPHPIKQQIWLNLLKSRMSPLRQSRLVQRRMKTTTTPTLVGPSAASSVVASN
jgi:hypothetical protein